MGNEKDDNSKYKLDGVNIAAGDVFSRYCNEINKSTYGLSPYVSVADLSRGNFRGPKGFVFKHLPKGYLITGAMDGIGTKVTVIVASGKVVTSASNVIAMTAMDITRWGGLPLVFMNIFDARTFGEIDSETFKLCQEVMDGLKDIAHEHKYVLFNGESAELGLCVGSENPDAKLMFNWGGAMLGVYHPSKMILGDTLAPGQIVIALRDGGRSNGYSTFRKSLAMKYGPEWWNNLDALEDIIACASPSAQYDRLLNTAHGWFSENPLQSLIKMDLIVHLSGGAFESKLGEDILKPLNLSAELDDLFEPPEIMKKCAQWRGMTPRECYKTWNGGQGAIVVVDECEVKAFLTMAKEFNVEAKRVGRITEKKEHTVLIKSKFGDGTLLPY
ncbi:MAG: AIR synthase-related protein [Parcubacteria group bacterium]|jgi:phosphoribosylaminoimidazole (AIR) synthetase